MFPYFLVKKENQWEAIMEESDREKPQDEKPPSLMQKLNPFSAYNKNKKQQKCHTFLSSYFYGVVLQLLQNISKALEIEVTHACKLNFIVLGMSEFIRFEMFQEEYFFMKCVVNFKFIS